MAILIRIDPEALKQAAERNRVVNNTVEETTARLSNLVARLNEAWDGGASNQAVDALEEIRNKAKQLGQATAESASHLDVIADAFRSLDEGAGSPFSAISRISLKDMVLGRGWLPQFILRLIGTLRIEPDEVRAVGAQCREIAGMYVEASSDLQNMLSTLMSSWEGNAARRYHAETVEMIRSFAEMAESLEVFADKLNLAASRYEELDNSL